MFLLLIWGKWILWGTKATAICWWQWRRCFWVEKMSKYGGI